MADAVNSPSHYKRDGVPFECIDVIKAALTPEEFLGFLRGNVLKYQYRARHKHATPEGFAEDVRKAKWYNDRLVEALAGRPAGLAMTAEERKLVDDASEKQVAEELGVPLEKPRCPLGRPAGDFTGCPKALIAVRPVDRGNPDGGNQLALVCTETDLPCTNAT